MSAIEEKHTNNNNLHINRISIKINIAERIYSFRVGPEQEENIRKATKVITDKVMHYKERYPDRDAQDALSMATLNLVLKLIETENKNDLEPIQEEIDDLNCRLESYLDSENKNVLLNKQ